MVTNNARTSFLTTGLFVFVALAGLVPGAEAQNKVPAKNIPDISVSTVAELRAFPLAQRVVTLTDRIRGGTFVLDLVDTSTPDDGILTIVSGTKRYKRQLHNNTLLPSMAGAVGDSLTDDTQAVKLIVAAGEGRTVRFDKKYNVTTGQIVGTDNAHFVFGPAGRIVSTSASGNIISFSSKKNILIEGGTFYGANGDVKLIYTSYCENVQLRRMRVNRVGFLRAENSSQFKIENITGISSYTASYRGNLACLDLANTSYVDVNLCYFDGPNFGVQASGGDGNPDTDPGPAEVRVPVSLSVVRGATDITVRNTVCLNNFSGIWATMIERFTVQNCRVEESEDVGIDHEACKKVLLENCVSKNATNGAFSSFFINDEVEWRNLTVYNTRTGVKPFGIFGGPNGQSGTIKISNFRIYSTVLSTGGYQDGSYRNVEVSDGYFENVQLQFSNVNGHQQRFERNTFVHTLAGGPVSLLAGNVAPYNGAPASVRIADNKLFNNYGSTNGLAGYGIQVFHLPTFVEDVIERNRTSGYQLDIALQPQDNTVAANRARVILNDNTLGSAQLFIAAPQAGRLELNVLTDDRGNRDGAGNFYGTNVTAASLTAKAPTASPVFTGVPTAPTATTGTNTNQVATTGFVQQAVANATGAVPNDSLVVVSGQYGGTLTATKYAVTKKSSTTVTSGTSGTALYGAREQVNAPEFDTTGHSYVPVNVATATESAVNSAISGVGSAAGRYVKLPYAQVVTITGGINIAGPINNMVLDLNSCTLACGTGRIGELNIYSGNYRGLQIVNTGAAPAWIRNTATNAQKTAAGNTGYGSLGMYEGANIQAQVFNGKWVPGVRIKNIKFTNPSEDENCIFGNTYSATNNGGNGVGNNHFDIIVEDVEYVNCGGTGYEHNNTRDADGDTTTVAIKNVTQRRIRYSNLGLVSTKVPKYAPAGSLTGRHDIGLFSDIKGINPLFCSVESVRGRNITFTGCSSTVTTGNATGVSVTNGGANYYPMRYITVVNCSHVTSGTATGQPIEVADVAHALVQSFTGVTASVAKFKTSYSLIGSLTGTVGEGNNFRVTASGTAVLFLPGSTTTLFKGNDVSTVGSTSQSQVIGLEKNDTKDVTLVQIQENTIRRGNTTAPYIKFYRQENGAEVAAGSNTNTFTPNTLVSP